MPYEDENIEFARSAASALYGSSTQVNPERWDRIREQDFLQIAEEITGQRCLRNSFVRCPFHGSDSTPSFKIYDNDAFCFGCGQFYDAVSMVSKYRDISRVKALAWLEDFFHLPPLGDIPAEVEDDEREITFSQAKAEYIRRAAKAIRNSGNVRLAVEYLQYYFEGKAESSSFPLLSVLGPEAITKIAKEHGLE